MAYNRTVRCSNCWNTGHNRRTCPDIKAAIAKEAAEGKEGYFTKQKARETSRHRTRKCTFCNTSGHNRRSCTVLKGELATIADLTIRYRTKIVAWLKDLNIVEGSFVRYRQLERFNLRDINASEGVLRVGIVKSILWDNVTAWRTCHGEQALFTVDTHMRRQRPRYDRVVPGDVLPEFYKEACAEVGHATGISQVGYDRSKNIERVGDTVYVFDMPENWLDPATVQASVKVWLKGESSRYSLPSAFLLGDKLPSDEDDVN